MRRGGAGRGGVGWGGVGWVMAVVCVGGVSWASGLGGWGVWAGWGEPDGFERLKGGRAGKQAGGRAAAGGWTPGGRGWKGRVRLCRSQRPGHAVAGSRV